MSTKFIALLWVLRKPAEWKLQFTWVCKWIYVCTFHICCLVWMKFSLRDLNTVSSSYVFWENVYREGLAFLRGISEIKFTHVPTSFSATAIYCTLHHLYASHLTKVWQQVTTICSKNIALSLLFYLRTVIPGIFWTRIKIVKLLTW